MTNWDKLRQDAERAMSLPPMKEPPPGDIMPTHLILAPWAQELYAKGFDTPDGFFRIDFSTDPYTFYLDGVALPRDESGEVVWP